MIYFRPVRGIPEESLKMVQKFNTLEEMKQFVADIWNKKDDPVTVENVVIDRTFLWNDKENGWFNVKRVCIERPRSREALKSEPLCVGFYTTEVVAVNTNKNVEPPKKAKGHKKVEKEKILGKRLSVYERYKLLGLFKMDGIKDLVCIYEDTETGRKYATWDSLNKLEVKSKKHS